MSPHDERRFLFAYPVAYYLAFRAGRRAISLMLLLILPAMTSYLLRVMAWKIILGPEATAAAPTMNDVTVERHSNRSLLA